MTESKSDSEPSQGNRLGPILDLLASAGYFDASRSDLSESDKLFGGLAWAISSANSSDPTRTIDTVEDIEDAMRSMGCPHALRVTRSEDLDCAGIYPAVQWIVSLVKAKQHDSGHVNERKAAVLNELQLLKERIHEGGFDSTVQKLASLLKMSKALARQQSSFQSEWDMKRFQLLSEITELEEKLNGNRDGDLYDYLDHLICEMSKKLKFAKTELASKLRESVSLKRQIDELPIQAEVIQYEQRFSELNVHIQDRHRRTRKYYATYNALLEIKDLMLKETSLLNSVDTQFQDAIGNPTGRAKLIESMEAIFQGTRQKLEKVKLGLQVEHKALDTLMEQYSVAIANQRHCSALLKAFEEERRKNERLKEEHANIEKLRGQTSS